MTADTARRRGRRGLRWALLGALFISCPLVLWPAAGSPQAAADVLWLELTAHGRAAGAATGHGGHLLLLEIFSRLIGGHPFTAARAASVFLLTVTITTLAVAAAALRPSVPGRAMLATGFVFAAQTFVFAATGSIPPQLSAMAWVSLGLAISLHDQLAAGRHRRRLLSGLALGAVTALAIRADAGGALLLWPALLLLRDDGRWHPARAGRRLAAWLAGALLAQLAIGAGLSLTAASAAGATPGFESLAPVTAGWPEILWPGRAGSGGGGGSLRALALLVVGAALAAWSAAGDTSSAAAPAPHDETPRDRTDRNHGPLELRLLHLTPLVFAGGLLVASLFTGARPSPDDLLPGLPAAALFGAELFAAAGLARLTGRELLTPRFLLPALAVAALVGWIEPYLGGRLAPAELVPWLSPAAAGDLVRRTIAPGLAMGALIAAALGLRHARLRLPILLAAAVLALGPGLAATVRLLGARQPAQRAAAMVYPWRQLDGAIEIAAGTRIALSPALVRSGRVPGVPGVGESIARLVFEVPTLELATDRRAMKHADYVLVDGSETWDRRRFERVANGHPRGVGGLGDLVLLRPVGKNRAKSRERRSEKRRPPGAGR